MITVHHLDNSRSQRVLWLLEELAVPYEITLHKRDPKTMLAPRSLRDVHPLGKAPVIVDGDETYAETGAIVEHLLEAHGAGRLEPARGTKERDRFRFWLHYAEGSAMPPLLLKLVASQLGPQSPALVRPLVGAIGKQLQTGYVDRQLDVHLSFWEAELGKSAWFAGGEFTAADVMMSFPVEALVSRYAPARDKPRLRAFLDAIHERPAYKRALERGGPYAYA